MQSNIEQQSLHTDQTVRRAFSSSAWLRSARLPSQSYLALSIATGWALAARGGHPAPPLLLVLLHLYAVAQQLHIVWANDLADEDSDRLNTTPTAFSGGSRVLVRGDLHPAQLRWAATFSALAAIAITFFIAVTFGRLFAPLFGLAALALLYAYSFAPIRLSYRGGGEWLQVAGLGVLLPWFALYASGAPPTVPIITTLAALLPCQFACAVIVSVPDLSSDAASGKRSFAVRHGAWPTTILASLLIFLSACALLVMGNAHPRLAAVAGAVALAQLVIGRAPAGSKKLSVRLTLLISAALLIPLAVVVGPDY